MLYSGFEGKIHILFYSILFYSILFYSILFYSIKGLDDKYIELFRLVFCLFRFNRNIETLCFGIEAKQRFVSDSAETSFGCSFGCFESKLVSKDTLLLTLSHSRLLSHNSLLFREILLTLYHSRLLSHN